MSLYLIAGDDAPFDLAPPGARLPSARRQR
jgi:hypothetical protein